MGADEDVDFAFTEVGEDFAEAVFFGHGIGVHADDLCIWDELGDDFFYALGAAAFKFYFCRSALWAAFGGFLGMAADVAFELVIEAVVSEGDATVFALCQVFAFEAEEAGRVAAAVDEEDGLFFGFEAVPEFL